jgi:hypothetical protein
MMLMETFLYFTQINEIKTPVDFDVIYIYNVIPAATNKNLYKEINSKIIHINYKNIHVNYNKAQKRNGEIKGEYEKLSSIIV